MDIFYAQKTGRTRDNDFWVLKYNFQNQKLSIIKMLTVEMDVLNEVMASE